MSRLSRANRFDPILATVARMDDQGLRAEREIVAGHLEIGSARNAENRLLAIPPSAAPQSLPAIAAPGASSEAGTSAGAPRLGVFVVNDGGDIKLVIGNRRRAGVAVDRGARAADGNSRRDAIDRAARPASVIDQHENGPQWLRAATSAALACCSSPPPGRVGAEFLGLARLFRSKIALYQDREGEEVRRILAPPKPRPGWSSPDKARVAVRPLRPLQSLAARLPPRSRCRR